MTEQQLDSEDLAEAKLDCKTCVWKMNSLGIEGSPILDRCILPLHRRMYLSSLPLIDPCNQGAEFLHPCGLSYRLNSASLHPWPIDGSSALQSALFCLAVHSLSLLIDFLLLLSFWVSCVSHPVFLNIGVCSFLRPQWRSPLCSSLFFQMLTLGVNPWRKHHYSLVS